MPITSAWLNNHRLVVNRSKVIADQHGFVVFLDQTNLPESLDNCKPDGSDIRITTDSAGLIECPIEIITFSLSPRIIKISTKLPLVSSTFHYPFYIWWNNPAAQMYGPNDIYGSNSVKSVANTNSWIKSQENNTKSPKTFITIGTPYNIIPERTINGTYESSVEIPSVATDVKTILMDFSVHKYDLTKLIKSWVEYSSDNGVTWNHIAGFEGGGVVTSSPEGQPRLEVRPCDSRLKGNKLRLKIVTTEPVHLSLILTTE